MLKDNKKSTPSSYHGKRRLSLGRRIYYFFSLPLLLIAIKILTFTYKTKIIDKHGIIEDITKNNIVTAPCYWHGHSFVCLTLILTWIKKGLNAGFVVSPSVDGEIPATIARKSGAHVIRGSAVRTGASAMMGVHNLAKQGISIVTAADGPLGPKYTFKSGVILMAKINQTPIIPMACAASNSWQLNRWDNFFIPKPFSRIIIMIGEPYKIPKNCTLVELEEHKNIVQDTMNQLMKESNKYV